MAVEADSSDVASRPGATIVGFNEFIQHAGLGKNRYLSSSVFSCLAGC
jgi:hypothetical protein